MIQGYNAFQSYAFGSVYGGFPAQSSQTPALWGGIGLPPGFGVQGGFGVQSSFWSQLMQVQQNLFQGWQNFCGCQGQRDSGRHHNHNTRDRFRDCFGGRQRTCGPRPRPTCSNEQTAPTTPTTPPAPTTSTAQAAPATRAPLTRATVTALPTPPRTQTTTALPRATSPIVASAAHNYGAFGPAGGGNAMGIVANASYWNTTQNSQAIAIGR